ncbi:MAG: hypothetical protein WA635_00960, partial [Gallionella sp.]
PEHQKTASYGSSKQENFTDIGEVCVVNSMFGKAKIRVVHPRKKRSMIWPLAALIVTGTAAIVWLEQDTPKPPEPMRIIVRSVDSEGAVQTNSQQLQVSPTIVNNAPPPAAPIKPQTTSGLNAKAAVVAKPVIVQSAVPMVKSEPAMTVPEKTPLSASAVQPKNPTVILPAAKPPAAIQPAAAQAAAPVTKNENPVATPAAETPPENKTIVPSSDTTAPDKTGSQP